MSLRWKKLNLNKNFWIKTEENLRLKKNSYGGNW